jgi:Flp pilus assembly protein TadD
MSRTATLAALVLVSTSTAWAAPADYSPPQPVNRVLDALFGKLGHAPSADAAKPIEDEILNAFLQSGSPSVDLLMTRAAALLEARDADTAGKILGAVTRIAPAFAEGWHQLGKLQADAGHDGAAMVSLQKAVNLNPRQFEAQMELGDMLAEYGARPAALASYKKALALDPHLEGLDRRVQQLSREVEGEKI